MSASDAAPLPRLGEVFFDVRGDSRSMRLSWYADTGVAVFSIWQGGMCTGTFRLPIDDLPRMIETLQRGPEQRRRPIKDRSQGGEREDYQRSRNEPGYYGDGDYGDGDGGYDDAGYQPGAYDQGGYDNSGHEAGGYDNARHEGGGYVQGRYDAGHEGGGYVQGRYDAGHEGAGYGEGGYDDAPSGDPAGYPDVHGYGHATADVPSRGGTSRSDVPTGTYWRQPDGYQPGEYHGDSHRSDGYQADGYRSAGYQTDRYQSDSYQTDGYQTAAYPSGPRIQFAIGNFFGFYFVNVRSHVTYCKNLGVDISAFTKAFEAANQEMYEQAGKLLYRRGMTEEQLFKQMETSLASMTAKNMDDLAATDKLTTRQECEIQLQNLEARVARVNFAKFNQTSRKYCGRRSEFSQRVRWVCTSVRCSWPH